MERLLEIADEELDKLFEDNISDEEFSNAYNEFRKKYEGLFVFNPIDKYDVSPYIPKFVNDDDVLAYLIGENKRIVIADQIIEIQTENAMRDVDYRLFADNSHLQEIEDEFDNLMVTRAVNYENAPVNGFVKKDGKIKYIVEFRHDKNRFDTSVEVHFGAQKKKTLYWARTNKDFFLKVIRLTNFRFQYVDNGVLWSSDTPRVVYDAINKGTFNFILGSGIGGYGVPYRGTAMFWPGSFVEKDKNGYVLETVNHYGTKVECPKLVESKGWPIEVDLTIK